MTDGSRTDQAEVAARLARSIAIAIDESGWNPDALAALPALTGPVVAQLLSFVTTFAGPVDLGTVPQPFDLARFRETYDLAARITRVVDERERPFLARAEDNRRLLGQLAFQFATWPNSLALSMTRGEA